MAVKSDATFDNVVKTTVYLKDMNDFKAMNEIYKNYEINPLSRMVFMYFYIEGEINGEKFYKMSRIMLRANEYYSLGAPE